MLGASWWVFEIVQEGGLMDGTSKIFHSKKLILIFFKFSKKFFSGHIFCYRV